ncbi:transposase [Labrenzia aggregata]|uniref:Transposase n=1 Tax=Roseibium aggregatum TaxID=187304 RepID=A0A926P3L0_9HYPH|nr:transposase [Roseibium aggregatum]
MDASPQRPRRRWSEEAKARLVEASLEPGANVSAIAREAGLSPSQLFGWRRKAVRSGAVRPREEANQLGTASRTWKLLSSVIGADIETDTVSSSAPSVSQPLAHNLMPR